MVSGNKMKNYIKTYLKHGWWTQCYYMFTNRKLLVLHLEHISITCLPPYPVQYWEINDITVNIFSLACTNIKSSVDVTHMQPVKAHLVRMLLVCELSRAGNAQRAGLFHIRLLIKSAPGSYDLKFRFHSCFIKLTSSWSLHLLL